MVDLDKLMKLYNKSTPGPWGVREWDSGSVEVCSLADSNEYPVCRVTCREDAFFIVALVSAFPDLVRYIRDIEYQNVYLTNKLELENDLINYGNGTGLKRTHNEG